MLEFFLLNVIGCANEGSTVKLFVISSSTLNNSSAMADPKFANLPGIVSDQPDVYETADDIPEPETSDYYEEEPESDQIERLHISTKDSYNRFKGKYLTGYVDFSDRIGKQARPGYNALYV